MTSERRSITWGNSIAENLDPFVVDVFGQIFNSQSDSQKPLTQFDSDGVLKVWRRTMSHATGKRSGTTGLELINKQGLTRDVEAGRTLRVHSKTDNEMNPEHEQWTPVVTKCAAWRFLDQTPSKLTSQKVNQLWRDKSVPVSERVRLATRPARVVPQEWIPAAGDLDSGWAVLRLPDRFVTLFHGPSMAALIFK